MRGAADTWRGWFALVAFVLALLAGAFLHPVQERQFHVCDAPNGHVEADHGSDHEHGAHACALCHLVQTVSNSTCTVTPPTLELSAPPVRLPGATSTLDVASAAPRRLTCRGPPAAA